MYAQFCKTIYFKQFSLAKSRVSNQTTNNRVTIAYRARDLKRHQSRVTASFSRSSNPLACTLGGQSVMPSGIVKAGDCETTNLDSNLLIAVLGDASTRRVCWSWSGRRASAAANTMRAQYRTRYANIAEHPFMPPMARTMIVLRLAAWEARACR